LSTRAIEPSRGKIDIHVHLAGVGTQGSGCWISPRFRRRFSFVGLRLLYRIGRRQLQTTVDQDWAAMLSAIVAESEVDFAVSLGFDGVYDSRGELDRTRTQMLVPPSWVFEVAGRYANLLPGPSINPTRRDALDCLEQALESGAVLIKWLPIVQGFDPAAPAIRPFLRRAADAGIPLLVHAGSGEVTFRTIDPSVGGVERLVPALELGATVIVAHSAAPVSYLLERSQVDLLRRLLERYPRLWAENSGLANPSRFVHLPRFADDDLIRERTLHGSDFPVVPSAMYYPRRLGVRSVLEIARERNAIQKDVLLKRALGFGERSFTRANTVLANLDRW
jgi:uncharacterized protein